MIILAATFALNLVPMIPCPTEYDAAVECAQGALADYYARVEAYHACVDAGRTDCGSEPNKTPEEEAALDTCWGPYDQCIAERESP